ncbi:hypothetical protein [Mesorhizobium sp. Pch-S]|uniref:hypothetical protein n=1 Tax=Mesorhizobium sp. Pch-S TaxID=2082387 RepID=UPI001012ACD4|nr:hypothetical protein [Mesorhizobium sp. Pch-S]QAZ46759.1 hypothetical protein C1M53_31390 [Mesorhizobium sp. Pch-S]
MIEVELPDGAIAEFPDGTSPDAIKGALQKRFGRLQPSQGLRAGLSELSALTQKAGRYNTPPEIAAAADQYEKGAGTGLLADMTGSGMANAVPFADELYSALSALPKAAISAVQGKGFHPADEYNRSQDLQAELQRRRSERHPIASTVGSIAGGLGATAPLATGGLSFLNGAKPTVASMGGRAAAEGAAYGTAYGAGEGKGLDERLWNALRGFLSGGAVGGTFGSVAGKLASKVSNAAVPTVEDLRTAGQAAYQQADNAGVIFTPEAVNRLKMDVGKRLVDLGYDPALQPGAAAVVKRIDDLAGQNVTFTGLDTLRKVASNGYVPGNKSNNKAVGGIINAIDDLIKSPKPSEVLAGDTQLASDAVTRGREIWSRLSKNERVADAIERAELRAASTGSGGNVDNAIRQNLRRLLENPRGFTEAEIAALRKVVEGTATQNALRLAGKLSPSGNGLMAALGIGGTMINPAVGVASLGGMGAKAIADGMTKANTGALSSLIRSGGAPAQQPLTPLMQMITEALSRGSGQQLPGYTGR